MNEIKNKNPQSFATMDIVHSHAAGIDVGSRSHYVATGQGKEDVKEFGVYTEDLHLLCKHLVNNNVTATALESTGSYWQPLFVLLQQYNLHPILVNGKFTKNVKGRKTDVADCQCLPDRRRGYKNCTRWACWKAVLYLICLPKQSVNITGTGNAW